MMFTTFATFIVFVKHASFLNITSLIEERKCEQNTENKFFTYSNNKNWGCNSHSLIRPHKVFLPATLVQAKQPIPWPLDFIDLKYLIP